MIRQVSRLSKQVCPKPTPALKSPSNVSKSKFNFSNSRHFKTARSPAQNTNFKQFFCTNKQIEKKKTDALEQRIDPSKFRPIERPYGRNLKIRENHHSSTHVATVFGSTGNSRLFCASRLRFAPAWGRPIPNMRHSFSNPFSTSNHFLKSHALSHRFKKKKKKPGLIGRYATNRLCRTGAQVLLPYRGEETAYRHMKVMGEVGQLVPIQYQIRDVDAISQMVNHSNIVVNMVSRNYSTRNFDMYESNVEIAKNIAKAAAVADPDRFIFVSCIGASPNAKSQWARYKYEAEEVTKKYIPHATILRLGPVFGPEDRLFNRFGYMQNYWGFVPLLWSKKKEFRPLHYKDFASAITSVLALPESCGKTYELAGNEQLSWDEFVHDVLFQYTLGSWRHGKFFEVPPPLNTYSI